MYDPLELHIARRLFEAKRVRINGLHELLFGAPISFEELLERTEKNTIVGSVLADLLTDAREAVIAFNSFREEEHGNGR